MSEHLGVEAGQGLERSCGKGARDRIVMDSGRSGIERIEAEFSGNAYSPHRHCTYAIGLTTGGVQTFHYRGQRRMSLPGNAIILHPDEMHDGGAGDERRLRYKMIYLDPAHLLPALGRYSDTLPFVSQPVLSDPELARLLVSVLSNMDEELEDLQIDGFIACLAPVLARLSGAPTSGIRHIANRQVHAAKAFLEENRFEKIGSEQLEAVTGMDRFALARHFRALIGTSPHRYQLMRRLEGAKFRITLGMGIADVAAESGFADQAHLTRHFKKTYGMTPGRWRELARARE